MQWIIDIIFEKVMLGFKGIICQWSGAIVDIPTGWHLCDGTAGTLDLRDKFIVGAGDGYAVGATGGRTVHLHAFTSAKHKHDILEGDMIADGDEYSDTTLDTTVTGLTDTEDARPPYYALAYIQKI